MSYCAFQIGVYALCYLIRPWFSVICDKFCLSPHNAGYAPAGGSGGSTVQGEPALALPDLDRRFHEFLLTVYHRREHGETKAAPQERWVAGGFLPRLPDSLEQLDLLLLTVAKARRVHPDGIRFQGLRYIDPTLAAYVGEDVLSRYDPRDLAEIRVFHQDRFLCRFGVWAQQEGEKTERRFSAVEM